MTLWGAKRNSPTTRDSFPRFNIAGPDVPLSGNITRICVLVHSRIGAGTPLKSTASWPGFLWPNPRPEITTGLPTGPSVGSRVIGIMTVKVTGAVVLYCTGAQQDPSGKGSMEATLTTSGPVIAFDGTFTSMRVSRHCSTRPGALFLPKSTALYLVDTNFPNPSPVMVTAMPIGPESGVIAGAADATLVTKTPRSKMPTHPNAFMQRNRAMCENSIYFKRKFRTITRRSQEVSRRGNGRIAGPVAEPP